MMNRIDLKAIWKAEENAAHIHGWDFSHIHGRYREEADLPWDYKKMIKKYLREDMRILDYDTGGGEFLLSLGHPFDKTAATEGYQPNVKLCKETLLPDAEKPFPDMNLREQKKVFEAAGFEIIEADEAFRPIKFYDIGAFVWFARIIEWEFPNFSVDRCFERLLEMQKILEDKGCVEGTTHRYRIMARK